MSEDEQTIVLVKASPQPSTRYGETVCCAGVTREGAWRRLFPIRFRNLTGPAQFSRWDIVQYRARLPKDDRRRESRRVEEDSLKIVGKVPVPERSGFFNGLVRPSLAVAASAGESLTLVRPTSLKFRARLKTPAEIAGEKVRASAPLAQGGLWEPPLQALEVCPYHLRILFADADDSHGMACADWETTATYWKWSKKYGVAETLERLRVTYEETYWRKGVALALGTVAKRPRQWLLLGVIRLDEPAQPNLL